MPQSTTHQTRVGFTAPSLSTLTCTTCAMKLPKPMQSAMPRPCPAGSGLPQPERSAAICSTAFARGFVPSKRDPVRQRILLRVGGELVDEALDHEGPARHANAAPPRSRNARRFLRDPVDVNVAERVRLVRRALDRVGIDAILDPGRAVARDDRRAGDAMRPGRSACPARPRPRSSRS